MRKKAISFPILPSLIFLLFFALSAVTAEGGNFLFSGKTDKDPLSYQPGETIVFSLVLYEDGVQVGGKKVLWIREGDDGKREEGTLTTSSDDYVSVETTLEEPGFVHFQALVLDENENPITREYVDQLGNHIRDESQQLNLSAAVHPESLTSYPEPDDFDAFWTRQKERLAAVPMNPELTEIPSGDDEVVSYDFRLDAVGETKVSGYFSKPKNAAPKSLPGYMFLHGYGVYSAFLQPQEAKSALVINANVHGVENGRPDDFYGNLKRTTLADYGFYGNENAETCYWNGLILRMLRALEFLKSQPEWDGKTIRLVGGSQGGFQSIVLAGLDHDVSEVHAGVPWLCDISGPAKSGRIGSFFRPEWTDALGYYDTVNHAKRVECPTSIDAGLGDYICPPSGVMVLYNNLKCPKSIVFTQGRTHMFGGMPNPTTTSLQSE